MGFSEILSLSHDLNDRHKLNDLLSKFRFVVKDYYFKKEPSTKSELIYERLFNDLVTDVKTSSFPFIRHKPYEIFDLKHGEKFGYRVWFNDDGLNWVIGPGGIYIEIVKLNEYFHIWRIN